MLQRTWSREAVRRVDLSWLMAPPLRLVWYGLLVAVAYYLGLMVGFALKFAPAPVSIFWPPNSILLAALLLAPARTWWALILAALPAHMLGQLHYGVPVLMATCWFFTNTSQALLGAIGVRLFDSTPRFDNVRSLTIFVVFAVILAPFVTSFFDAGFVTFLGWGKAGYWTVWSIRFVSNVLTTLTLVPIIVTLGSGGVAWLRRAAPRHYVEAGLLLLGLVAVERTALSRWSPESPALLYAPVPLLLWAAIRFGLVGASVSLLTMALLSIWVTHQRGSAVSMTPTDSMLAVHMFLIAISLPLILLAVTLAERRRIEQTLRENEQRYRDVVENQTELICRFRQDTTLTFVNEAYCRYFGRSREELIGRQFLELIPENSRSVTLANVTALFAMPDRSFVREHEVLRPDGKWGWHVWTSRAIVGPDGTVVEAQGVGHDLTDQRLAERALHYTSEALRRSRNQIQELAGRLITVQEDERRRISRELHDDINQKLAAIAIAMSSLRRSMPASGREELAQLQSRINALTNDIRRISHELHPAVLTHAGLAVALRAYCAEFSAATGINVVLNIVHEEFSLPHPASLCLYRVAQEALHNIEKHSGTSEAHVSLHRDSDSIEVSIRDDGVGFDPVVVRRQPGGLGLVSIEERIRLVQGSVEILTAPGHGVEVRARVPLDTPDEAPADDRASIEVTPRASGARFVNRRERAR